METYEISFLGKDGELLFDHQTARDELHALAQHIQKYPRSINPVLTRVK